MNRSNNHSIQLDGLRFYAVVFVMVAHWLQWQWGNPILSKIPFAHGVTLFFVLSGFLITRILFLNKDKSVDKSARTQLIKNFYIRRVLRIFPIYYITILVLFIANIDTTREIFWWLITYTTNIYQSIYDLDIGRLNHFWSLAIEEQFYLFWPFLILIVRNRNILMVIIGVILVALLARCCIYFGTGNWRAASFFTLSSMDGLGLGALIAYVTIYKPHLIEKLSKSSLLYISIGMYTLLFLLSLFFHWHWYNPVLDNFFFSIVAGLIVLKASYSGFNRFPKFLLENKLATYSGKISYGLYVYHLFIPGLVLWVSPKVLPLNADFVLTKYIFFVLYYVITFVIAFISFQLIEKPINKLKDKFPY